MEKRKTSWPYRVFKPMSFSQLSRYRRENFEHYLRSSAAGKRKYLHDYLMNLPNKNPEKYQRKHWSQNLEIGTVIELPKIRK
jgi:Trm5-related predicted tRNA methylase